MPLLRTDSWRPSYRSSTNYVVLQGPLGGGYSHSHQGISLGYFVRRSFSRFWVSLAAICGLLLPAVGSAVVIDFDGLTSADLDANNDLVTQGFVFDSVYPAVLAVDQYIFCGHCSEKVEFSLSAADGSAFNLYSFFYDVGSEFGWDPDASITGYLQGGGTVAVEAWEINNEYPNHRIHVLGPEWRNLLSVRFVIDTQGGGAGGNLGLHFDDFEVQTVPIPGAVWLMGSGMVVLLGWRRRRRV